MSNKNYYRQIRRWAWIEGEDEVAEYRSRDYDNAMTEISHLVEHVNNGDISLVCSEGFTIPSDSDLLELYRKDDGFHSLFPRITNNWEKK